MKKNSLIITLALAAALAAGGTAAAQSAPPPAPQKQPAQSPPTARPAPTARPEQPEQSEQPEPPEPPEQPEPAEADEGDAASERVVAAEPDVVVSLCLASGGIVVRGWEKREVRARSLEAEKIELSGSPASGAKRVEVLVSNDAHAELQTGDCGGTGSVELDVPRGATVFLQVRDGDVEVSEVAEARVESINGDVNLQAVSKGVEVKCLSGDISLADSGGRARLTSVSGSVEARNVRTVDASDYFNATSTSGDVTLENIAHTQVKGVTTSGAVSLTGPLARGGNYDLRTTSGDVTVELPADSSFKLTARVVASGEIITDFPVKATVAPAALKESHQTRLTGTVGAGDADVNLTTFSGTVHLKKQ